MGIRHWNVNILEFISNSDSQQVGFLRGVEVLWLTENGRLIKPVPQEGTEFSQQADLVLLAMGFVGPETGHLLENQPLKTDGQGRLGPGLYAAGDAANGPSLVVRAINDGLKVARTILSDYQGLARTGS
jgi:glutamate synthase (NADPH/NADH) small chain